MESMRRSEANSSHHPNKVAVNSLATESNKQSSGSGSVNNNNKLSFNQQQSNSIQQQKSSSSSSIGSSSSSSTTSSSSSSGASTSSESKDTNFEYDDNEWDVGGIGDLIIDLDADIEKSSSTAAGTGQSQSQQQQSSQQQAQQSSQQHQQQLVGSSLTAAISSLGAIGGSGCTTGGNSSQGQVNLLNANEKSPGSSSSSSSSSSPTTVSSSKSSLSSLFSPISSLGHSSSLQKQQNSSGIASLSSSSAPTTSSSLSASSSAKSSSSKQSSSKAHTNLKVQQSALVAQLNSSGSKAPSDHQRLSSSSSFVASSRGTQGGISNNISSGHNSGGGNSHNISGSQSLQTVDRHSKLLSGSTTASMSSQPSGGQAAGKTATKMSIDHQATLDKGLKMKIKRTKPGTKTSEAKHEIVKAEQNGTSSNIEESNSISNNSSSGKKHNQVNTAPSVQSVPAQQATKRGSSSHRRDKTRDKTPHSRDKTEHSSSNSSSGSSGNSSSSSNSSNTSNSHSNSSSSADRSSSSSTSSSTCNCSHELQVNGVQAPCTNISCIRNRTSAGMEQPSNAALAQRIVASSAAGQTNSSSSLGRSSTVSSNLNVNSSSSNNATSGFPSSNNSGNAQSSISGTPNAPGPPKDGSKISSANVVLPNHQQSGSQLSNSSNALSNVQQQQPQQQQQQQQQNQTSLTLSGSVHNIPGQNGSNSKSNSSNASISATIHHTVSVAGNSALTSSVSNCDDGSSSPPAKRAKCDAKDMVDICVGTSVGTITEPDCLGPCEPGTSVTLEGIVWHETEGGVLVVNVTWRGKTYVGTLLDCTRHDWAPPRFCDSPTEELDSRTPKGRGKRGRSAALTPDLSNFTETRSSVHSKLRNGGAKGRGGRGITTGNLTTTTTTSTTTTASGSSSSSNSSSSATNSNTPSTSPTAFLPPRPEKRKSKDESPSPVNGESGNPQSQTQSLVNPVTGLNVQISTKKCKTASPCAISPVLLECPEQDCSKKYKHANGLRYHQSHAHGSGSMDEDSLQLPESPRICPPTTPSPAPATTPQPQVSGSSANAVPSSPVSNGGGMGVTSSASTTCSPSPNSVAITTSSSQSAPVVSVSSGGGLLTTVPSSICTTQAPTQQTPSQMPQHTIPGGSITAGISGQALSQHQQQQHSLLVGAVPNSSLMQTGNQGLPEGGAQALSAAAQQQAHQAHQAQQQSNQPAPQQPSQAPIHTSNSNMPATPTRGDQSAKIKPGVLRFGPPSDNLTPNSQGPLSSQSPLRPTAAAAMAPNAGPPSTPESAHQPSYNPATGQVVQQGKSFPELPNLPEPLRGHGPPQSVPITKPQNYGKQKKNRKSPVPGDFDNSTSRDDVQSPAYSDISDDSTPVVDPEIVDKSQSVKHPDVKKSQDGAPPQMPPLGGYGMYQFYSQQPYMVPPEHQAPKVPSSQSAMPPSSPADYNKNKEPPLDLMTKPAQQSDPNPKEISVPTSGGPPAPNPNKPLSHFYPFNYMPPGYSYNMDPNYGPVSMVSDESKVGPVPNPLSAIKEERIKESPSPHDHGKMSAQVRTPPNDYGKISVGLDHSQMMPTKLIKNEQKDIKSEPSSHGLHPKEPPVQSLGAYPSIYQRHSMGVPPQPPQHMSREEELRRYYIYPDQRRSNPSSSSGSNVPPSVSVKEEPASPSQSSLQHPSASHSQSQQSLSQMSSSVQNQSLQQSQNTSQQKSSKSSLSSSQSSSGPKPTNLIKDPKEEKEVTKIKQEGQKPTMETQGPPPPPTSQYFLHPSYISPGPFGFDPGHPMYRNVLMSTGPYNTPPYHLPMARFHAPEDLSRNPGTKALDALHHAASQYYNSHKIHELSERALKSPTSGNVKVSVSSPNVSQPPGGSSVNNSNGGGGGGPGGILPPSAASGGPLSLQPPSGSLPPGLGNAGVPLGIQKGDGKSGGDPSGKGGVGGGVVGSGAGADSRSPPPQRHVHTHHHTHVGLGYPMYPAPYGAAVLASQQAAAVAVINPFPPGPTK